MTNYIEPVEELSNADRNIHRALNSLKEEIEAIDWYHQRAAATSEPEIKSVLIHNLQEEVEHASMILEWLRRNMGNWDKNLRTYLFTTEPIGEIETSEKSTKTEISGDLGIGNLKESL
ncbi:MAG: ferritin [Candidatus Atribacteria bacterium]|nr:ferritin [Candidatus Atribacteria bacterium]